MTDNEQTSTQPEAVAPEQAEITADATIAKKAKPPLKLNYPQTIKVGFAFAIITAFWSAYDFVVPLLLENAYGLSDSLRGLIMGLDNLLSLFLLPLFGKISDKGKGRLSRKLGRRTPYILIGTIIAAVLMIFVPVSAQKQLNNATDLRNRIENITSYYNDGDTYTSSKGNTYNREQMLTYFYDEAYQEGNSKYCDKAYLDNNNITREQFIGSYQLPCKKISGFLGIGGTSYSLDDGKLLMFSVVENDDYKPYEWESAEAKANAIAEYRTANNLKADGSEDSTDKVLNLFQTKSSEQLIEMLKADNIFNTYSITGFNVWASEEVEATLTKSKDGSISIAFYMLILLAVLIAMATFRSPAVALMPDVTPKPLRSQANAMINLMGGIGGAFAFLIYTVVLFQKSLYNYTIIFGAVAGVMLILLAVFMKLVNEKKLVAGCESISAAYGIDNDPSDDPKPNNASEGVLSENQEKDSASVQAEPGKKRRATPKEWWNSKTKLEKSLFKSFLLILASIFMWFMGYNAVSSNLSVYCVKVLNLSPGIASIISGVSMGVSAIAFIPVGFLAVKIGRKKSIILGFILAAISYVLLFVIVRPGKSGVEIVFSLFYLIAGFGLIIANVNTFPMVVELAKAKDVGKYTGYYYTATMSAQAITPAIAGLVMTNVNQYGLFLYSAVCVGIAILLMIFVKHGDSDILRGKKLTKDEKKKVMLDSMGDAD